MRVNSPAPAAPTSQQAAASHLRRSQSAVVGSRESEERVEERARREEKRREGDPLEEVKQQTFSKTEILPFSQVREGIVRMMEERAGEAAAAESAL